MRVAFDAVENPAMANFRPIDRTTPYLLPPSLDDWLPKDHLARTALGALGTDHVYS